jgi:hypothetical protein
MESPDEKDMLEDRFGVPAELIEEIRQRRDGHNVPISPAYRLRRAYQVHTLVTDGIRSLLADPHDC